MTTPVFEHTVADLGVDTTVPTSVAARLDRMLRQWDEDDACNAHAEVEGYVASVREQVGEGQAFLDEDGFNPETLAERLEPLIDFCEQTPGLAAQEVRFAREALENAQRTFRVLQQIVDNLNDPTILDRVDRAVATLTPREEARP